MYCILKNIWHILRLTRRTKTCAISPHFGFYICGNNAVQQGQSVLTPIFPQPEENHMRSQCFPERMVVRFMRGWYTHQSECKNHGVHHTCTIYSYCSLLSCFFFICSLCSSCSSTRKLIKLFTDTCYSCSVFCNNVSANVHIQNSLSTVMGQHPAGLKLQQWLQVILCILLKITIMLV